jgi:hypothetical protein
VCSQERSATNRAMPRPRHGHCARQPQEWLNSMHHSQRRPNRSSAGTRQATRYVAVVR